MRIVRRTRGFERATSLRITLVVLGFGAGCTLDFDPSLLDGSASSATSTSSSASTSSSSTTTSSSTGGGDEPLLGAWSFDETTGAVAADSSGRGLDGTLSPGGASAPTWGTGKVGGALTFDGVDDYVIVDGAETLNTITTEITMAAWVLKHTDAVNGYAAYMNRQRGEAQSDSFYLGSGDATPTVCTAVGTTAGLEELCSNDIPLEEWTHVAATYDGVTLKLYVNGETAGSVLHSGTFNEEVHPLTIGAATNSLIPEEFANVTLDEVRLYRVALADEEIAALAQ